MINSVYMSHYFSLFPSILIIPLWLENSFEIYEELKSAANEHVQYAESILFIIFDGYCFLLIGINGSLRYRILIWKENNLWAILIGCAIANPQSWALQVVLDLK